MPIEEFTLPTGERVTLIYGAKHPGKGTTYLNAVRMGPVDEESGVAREYHSMENIYGEMLAAAVAQKASDFDAVVSPPSSRQDADPYRRAVLRRNKLAADLTNNFSRKGEVRVGQDGITLEQAINEIIYVSDGNESRVRSLLIVDESVASGKTVAALLHHMRNAGLSSECRVTVATWAKVGC